MPENIYNVLQYHSHTERATDQCNITDQQDANKTRLDCSNNKGKDAATKDKDKVGKEKNVYSNKSTNSAVTKVRETVTQETDKDNAAEENVLSNSTDSLVKEVTEALIKENSTDSLVKEVTEALIKENKRKAAVLERKKIRDQKYAEWKLKREKQKQNIASDPERYARIERVNRYNTKSQLLLKDIKEKLKAKKQEIK